MKPKIKVIFKYQSVLRTTWTYHRKASSQLEDETCEVMEAYSCQSSFLKVNPLTGSNSTEWAHQTDQIEVHSLWM